MKFHEKSLELNITHELLNLADSWYWFLTEIPLWRYWRPRYRLPFIKFPKSTAGGFHITSEGRPDPTGLSGGGYDVRIKSGVDGHLLFLQYKKGDIRTTSPGVESIFDKPPHDHFQFKINSTTTDQHFLLRDLAANVGAMKGNSVVYALPLIEDMADMEAHSGKLVRKTKFISVQDIDKQAADNGVTFLSKTEHSFRVAKTDMNLCEVNEDFFQYKNGDLAPDIIADIIALSFEKSLNFFLKEIYRDYKQYNLNDAYITEGIQRAYGQYLRYLLHYFEVSPRSLLNYKNLKFRNYFDSEYNFEEYREYSSNSRDIQIILAVTNALNTFSAFLGDPSKFIDFNKFTSDIPRFYPTTFLSIQKNEILTLNFSTNYDAELIDDISYLKL